MKNKNILITGGTGFIGFHLIKNCIKKKLNVTSISTKRPIIKNSSPKVKYILCDIRNKKKLRKLIKEDYNYVVNLGGYVDHSKLKKTFSSHFNGCVNLAEIFKNKKIESFIQIGSGLEYGKNSSHQMQPQSTQLRLRWMGSKDPD